MKYLIIPSAKCAPNNLPNIGKVPMVLYPINEKTILDYIVENYKQSQIVISGFEKFDKLRKYCKQEKFKKIKLFKINDLKDLGHTIYESINFLQLSEFDELVINFADTLIDNDDIPNNSIVFAKDSNLSSKWTYLIEKNGIIKSIIDQKEITKININDLKLIIGVFNFSHPLYLKQCLSMNINDNGISFFEALKMYSQKYPFNFIEAKHWLDLGHPMEYFNSQMSIKSREFNHITFDSNRGIITKTSENKDKFKGEIEWYLKLPKNLHYIYPRIFDNNLSTKKMFISMEFYSYPTLLELYLYGNIEKKDWEKIFNKIKFVLNDFSNYKIEDYNFNNSLLDMYYGKTLKRINLLQRNPKFQIFFKNEIIINNKKYLNLTEIKKNLKKIVMNNLLNEKFFCIIHGDLCFSNILIDDKLNFIKLIDPRGKFGEFDIFGDQRYDIAKLYHSIDGKYDYIIKDMFELNVHDNIIQYKIIDNHEFSIFDIMKMSFKNIINGREKEIEIIESLLFLSMIPLHNENIKHQYLMLARGLEILNRHVDIEVK